MDTQEEIESKVVTLFDQRIRPTSITKRLALTHQKTLRILERHARILPQKCLMCNQHLRTHTKCPDCGILLHHGLSGIARSHCWPPCINRNYQSNIT